MSGSTITQARSTVHLPKVEIQFCVKCKWNLRAAYYAQELLQTFCSPPSEITLGEISLVPVSGGIFTITLHHQPPLPSEPVQSPLSHAGEGPTPLASPNATLPNNIVDNAMEVTTTQIWDRKTDGGFPETKELKNRIRNLIDPSRNMGHIDRSLKKGKTEENEKADSGGVVAVAAAAAGEKILEGKEENVSKSNSGKLDEKAGEGRPGIKEERTGSKEESTVVNAADCEECRIEAREELEDEVGGIESRS